MPRYVILDTETTGLRWDEGHRVFEVGMIETHDRQVISDQLRVYFNPERTLSQESMEICKITNEELLKYSTFAQEAERVWEFLHRDYDQNDPTVIVAHNARFDLGFLGMEFSKCGLGDLSIFRVIDTVKMAKRSFPGQSASLDELCKRFQVELADREAAGHGALLDASLLSKVFFQLTAGKSHDEVINFDKVLEDFVGFTKRPQALKPRSFGGITTDEEAHAAILAKIKCGNAW